MPFIYMASWRKIPIVNHIHGADFDEFYVNAPEEKKDKIKKVYSKCNVLIALSDEWKERLSQIVPEDRIEIIQLPHPASTVQTKSPANNTHLQTSKPMIKINATADRPPPRYLSMKCT